MYETYRAYLDTINDRKSQKTQEREERIRYERLVNNMMSEEMKTIGEIERDNHRQKKDQIYTDNEQLAGEKAVLKGIQKMYA